MRIFIFISILILFASCVTKQKSVVKEEITSETTEREAYVGELNYERNTHALDLKDFTTIFSNLNWNYSGGNDDSFSIEVKQTADGYKAEMKGTGTAEGKVDYQSEIEALTQQYHDLYTEFEEFKSDYKKIDHSKSKILEKQKEEKSSPYLFPFIIAFILLLGIFIVYKYDF